MDELTTLARDCGPRGEVILRRRGSGDDAVEELIVNGAFTMDSGDSSSERALAELAFARAPAGGRMLVGGLGLGYTAQAALALPVGQLEVVELEPALVSWARAGVTPTLARLATEPRVRLVAGDVCEVLTDSAPDSWHAIALDVDNGPDFLIHTDNANLYTDAFLRLAYARLAPGGRLAIWCQGPSPALLRALGAVDCSAAEHLHSVRRGGRQFSYAICTLDRPADP